MSKAIVIIKSMGIGDLCILISSIQAISKKIAKPVTVLAQKNTPNPKNILEGFLALDQRSLTIAL